MGKRNRDHFEEGRTTPGYLGVPFVVRGISVKGRITPFCVLPSGGRLRGRWSSKKEDEAETGPVCSCCGEPGPG